MLINMLFIYFSLSWLLNAWWWHFFLCFCGWKMFNPEAEICFLYAFLVRNLFLNSQLFSLKLWDYLYDTIKSYWDINWSYKRSMKTFHFLHCWHVYPHNYIREWILNYWGLSMLVFFPLFFFSNSRILLAPISKMLIGSKGFALFGNCMKTLWMSLGSAVPLFAGVLCLKLMRNWEWWFIDLHCIGVIWMIPCFWWLTGKSKGSVERVKCWFLGGHQPYYIWHGVLGKTVEH